MHIAYLFFILLYRLIYPLARAQKGIETAKLKKIFRIKKHRKNFTVQRI
jgi:hypothetical protein